ncbi:hypothetical protein BJF88_04765 [Cellulosimicrobium sp. CUA-896]|nr:hypothetical protein BJF88_04765 [Cellulosimicrobium sp. CUA-896]
MTRGARTRRRDRRAAAVYAASLRRADPDGPITDREVRTLERLSPEGFDLVLRRFEAGDLGLPERRRVRTACGGPSPEHRNGGARYAAAPPPRSAYLFLWGLGYWYGPW